MGLIKLPNFQSIKSDASNKINGVCKEIQGNPNLDMDQMTSKIESDIGLDDYMSKIEQAEGYASKATEVVNFVRNPKGAAIRYLRKKAVEKIEEHPKTKETKEKIYEYVKTKAEGMPQYREAKSKIEKAKKAIPDTPQELQEIAKNPKILQEKIPELAKDLGLNINDWFPKK